MSKEYQVLRSHYWDKSKKKNVFKTANIAKFGSKEKAQEFLDNWKKEQMSKTNDKGETELNKVMDEIKDETNKDKYYEDRIPPIEYTEFNLNVPDLKKDACSTIIFGSSKSGKTTMALKLLEKYFSDDYVICIVFCPNIQADIYKDLGKKCIKIDRFDDQLIRDLHKIQKKTKNKYCFVIYIDDCILEKLSPQILQLFLILRNSRFNTLLNLQSVKLLSKNSRNNGQNFIFKRQNNTEAVEDCVKSFVGAYEPFFGLTLENKMKLYQEATKDYNFIYLNSLDGILTFHKADQI